MSNSGDGAHILVFPYPAQGHMLPMLDLTHQLAVRGLAITVLITPKNLPTLNPLLSSHPSIQTLVFPFPHHPSLPSGVENVRDVGNSGNRPIMNALGHLWDNIDAVRSLAVVDFPDLPRSPSFTREHLPSGLRLYRESDPDWQFVKDGMIANSSSWGCVLNSFEALEGDYLDHLKKNLGHGRVFGVGPLSLAGGFEPMGQINPNEGSGDGVFEWLDGCPDGSVLYVCFGSQKLLKRTQMEALSSGLERSGVRFVWVVNSVTGQEMKDGSGSVPDGFEDRVSGRGMVIKGWAPQVAILSHRAMGGFLSHCGWNSVLEGTVAGVMILAWPMEADQFVNARLLVEYMQAAVQVCDGADAVPDPVELAQIVAESISGDIIEKIRAKELREKALEAVKKGGSSWRDLDGLVRELAQLGF
ncbi:hypothetical protein F0562_033045 [Nyssa sinensis]|uniref:UDP-glycosyltransferases domain-containing protein n=1 Tax=Nyssa sinensis TaxID=561372 RepID=A0A5J5ARH1_9ASTE|nr:hypothetical protein F0562_033045 [Nyssa sinensis]